MQAVKVNAKSGKQSLMGGQPDGAAGLRQRRVVLANPLLLFFRRQIDTAVADAKKIRHGLPTDLAIQQRWWVNDYRPQRGDRSKLGRKLYGACFENCCEMLGLDVDAERKRVIAEIDDAAVKAMVQYAGNEIYERRARVLACSGVPTAVGRQFVLGLVAVEDYEDVADAGDVKTLGKALKREGSERARAASKRAKRLTAGQVLTR